MNEWMHACMNISNRHWQTLRCKGGSFRQKHDISRIAVVDSMAIPGFLICTFFGLFFCSICVRVAVKDAVA